MYAHGNITNRGYMDIPKKLQSKVNRAEKYALEHYEEHKKNQTKLFLEAQLEVHHNYIYDLIENKIALAQYEEMIKIEFIHRYAERMIWKDYWTKLKQNELKC